MNKNLRAPAVPLVTVDPYFSVWSGADNLYDDLTRHWTGKPNSMTGLILIDGKPWRFMGKTALKSPENPYFTAGEPEGMEQVSCVIKPLSTIYTFKAGGISLEVDFTTPLLPDDLDLLSRPASYVSFKVYSTDGMTHAVKIYMDVTGEWCVDAPDQPDQKIVWERKTIGNDAETMYMGSFRQNILAKRGDNVRIDWGYIHFVLPNKNNKNGCIHSHKQRRMFLNSGNIEINDDKRMRRDATGDDMPVMAAVIDFPSVGTAPIKDYVLLAYDDIFSIEYFKEFLPAYWRRSGMEFDEMLDRAIKEYDAVMKRCEAFNSKIYTEAEAAGGSKYADILSLAYRQAIAAHKVVADTEGNILFISKECFSNGCAATVDVTYPSIPLFLLYNPELVKGMLRPVYKYADSGMWPYEFAPHDVGRYPQVNGQVYQIKYKWFDTDADGNKLNNKVYKIDPDKSLIGQMPVEECGNMLIIEAAVALADKNVKFAQDHWKWLTQWADYLVKMGFDPGEQLCTDDFAGRLAHNTNLSVKAILGIGAYSMLCDMMGDKENSNKYLKIARELAVKWEDKAREDDHYKLTFVDNNTWSLKYNMIWDDIFGLNLFTAEAKQREVAFYIKKQNKYGIPLDCRDFRTKADWLVWAAALADKKEDFIKLVEPLWDFLNESPSRVPFTDMYGTTDRMERTFHHRSVVGGLFIKVLKDNWSRK